jgi:uncharacterized peroxidase-related enzyme
MVQDWRSADLDPADRAMLEFAEKLTRAPATVEDADVEALRQAGFDDVNILDIVYLSAYRNFTNRFALGLGIAPDPGVTGDTEMVDDFEAIGGR